MTTPIVMSITDELLAEIEAAYLAGWNESAEGYNAEHPQTVKVAEAVAANAKDLASRCSMLERLRAAEKDAARYRWLRDKALEGSGVAPAVLMVGDTCAPAFDDHGFGHVSARGGKNLDDEMDEAMERQP